MKMIIYCQSAALGRGGMERTAANVANEMCRRGHEVCFVYEIEPDGLLSAYPLSPGVRVLPWHGDLCDSVFYALMADLKPQVALLLYSNRGNITRPFRLLANADMPIVLHEGTNPQRIRHTWDLNSDADVNAYQRSVYHGAASAVRVTLPSYLAAIELADESRKRAFPNAFSRSEHGENDRRQRQIIHINGFKQNKNLLPLLQAMQALRADFPDWRLLLVGEQRNNNAYHQSIYQYIADHQLAAQVCFAGMVENMDKVFAQSAIHVISSHSEGLPNAVAEAMCHGVPSIGYAFCPGTNELIINNENGLLVTAQVGDVSDEVSALTGALRTLMTDAALRQRLGHQAWQDAQMFAPDVVFDQWEGLLGDAAQDLSFTAALKQKQPNIRREELRRQQLRQLRHWGIDVEGREAEVEGREIESREVKAPVTILFILTNAPLGSLGTAGTYEVIRRLAKIYRVKVLSLPRKASVAFDDSDFDVTYVDSFAAAPMSPFNQQLLQQLLVKGRVDVIHLYRGQGEFELLNAIHHIKHQNRLAVKIVYDIKSPLLVAESRRRKLLFSVQKSAPLVDHIISLSDFTLSHNMPVPWCPHSIIPLGINIPKGHQGVDACNRITNLVYIGSLALQRNLLALIRWFAAYLKSSARPLCLHLYGDGDQSEQIVAYIEANKLSEWIGLKGFVPQAELFARLADYDAGIAYVPDNESFTGSPSLKSIEFAALGLPVLATDTLAHRQYAQDYGLEMRLFADNQQAFHQALDRLASKGVTTQALQRNMQQAKRFEFDNVVREYIQPIYRQLLNGNQPLIAPAQQKNLSGEKQPAIAASDERLKSELLAVLRENQDLLKRVAGYQAELEYYRQKQAQSNMPDIVKAQKKPQGKAQRATRPDKAGAYRDDAQLGLQQEAIRIECSYYYRLGAILTASNQGLLLSLLLAPWQSLMLAFDIVSKRGRRLEQNRLRQVQWDDSVDWQARVTHLSASAAYLAGKRVIEAFTRKKQT